MLIIIDMTGENEDQEEMNEEKNENDNIPKKNNLDELSIRSPQLQIVGT